VGGSVKAPQPIAFQFAAGFPAVLVVTITALASPASGQQPFTARDRDFYWYGIGAGIAITVCELERNGDVSKGFARRFIHDAINSGELRKQPKAVEALIDASQFKNCKGL
jgi:hypothetical protein